MNIKQASQHSGVSPQNIRYYEKEGLLSPQRNPDNDYRMYSEKDVHILKLIRILRMLDMPLEDIRGVLDGSVTLPLGLQQQELRLKAKSEELQAALRFCRELKSKAPDVSRLDVDACLTKMESGTSNGGFFAGWVNDYKRVVQAQHKEDFTFVPDGPVTNPREFTDALLAWARASNKDLVITREGMYPHFVMNGVEYEAQRIYRRIGYRYFSTPLAIVRCHCCTDMEIDASVLPVRRRLLRILRCSLPSLFLFAMIMIPCSGWLFAPGQSAEDIFIGVFTVTALAVMCGLTAWFNYYYHFNDQTK